MTVTCAFKHMAVGGRPKSIDNTIPQNVVRVDIYLAAIHPYMKPVYIKVDYSRGKLPSYTDIDQIYISLSP